MADFAFICGLCNKEVGDDDYSRELDCTRACENNVYHECCIEKYLRKHGRGGEQKTGFCCPALSSNGKPCVGKIKRTHVRVPVNSKKKELNRQAAVTTNVAANIVRVSASTKVKEVVKQPGRNPVAEASQPAAVKPLSAHAISALEKVESGAGRRIDLPCKGDLTFAEDFSNFRQIASKRSALRNDGESESESNSSEPVRPRNRTSESEYNMQVLRQSSIKSATNANQPAQQRVSAMMAVSKNAATAPKPVVRQRVAPPPGWTGPLKQTTSGSTLKQQRELVAALRAKEKFGLANRASSIGSAAEAGDANGRKGAVAAQSAGRAWEPTNTTATAGAEPQDAGEHNPKLTTSTGAATAGATAAECDAAMKLRSGLATLPSARLMKEGAALLRRSSSFGEDDDASSPNASALTASRNEAEPVSPAPLPFAAGGAQRAMQAEEGGETDDPITGYDQLYHTEDGTVVVQDRHTGLYYRVEDVYGAAPEVTAIQDEAGNLEYYVVIRASFAAPVSWAAGREQQQQQQADEHHEEDVADVGVTTGAGERARLHLLSAGQEAHCVEVDEPAVEGGMDEEDDFDDLLNLCLG